MITLNIAKEVKKADWPKVEAFPIVHEGPGFKDHQDPETKIVYRVKAADWLNAKKIYVAHY